MVNVLTASQMKKIENHTMQIFGISSPVLMERAALAAFDHIKNDKYGKVLVMAGNGNNGGDGIAVARMMHLDGWNVQLCLIGNREKATKENVMQLNTYLAIGGKTIGFNSIKGLDCLEYDILVDAILGIGISRKLEGEYLDAVNVINNSSAYIYSLDIPTGLNTDTGNAMGEAVKAHETLCFSEYKLGLLVNKGPEYTGKLYVFDVGIVRSDIVGDEQYVHSITKEDKLRLMPQRPVTGHKGTFGKILVIGGSEKMAGAALLACKSAFAAGAGMVKLISPKINRGAILSILPELMYKESDDVNDDSLKDDIMWADVIIIGPGLSTDDVACGMVEYVLSNANIPVVVDADAINITANHIDWLVSRKNKKLITVMTPHPGEFNRLFGNKNHEHVSASDCSCVTELAGQYGIILVAKNAKTIISDGEETYINMSGANGMGTAGSGDVLTGIVATMMHNCMRNEMSPVLSVAFAVYAHGYSGEVAAINKSNYSMTATDIIDGLHDFYKE